MSNKRGQITVFIVIGIVLLIIIGAYFALTNNIASRGGEDASLPFDVQSVKTGVENCLALRLNDLLDQMSSQGGYFIPENPMVQYDYGLESAYIPYYLYNRSYYAPSNEAIMRQLEIGYDYYASACYNYTDPNYDLVLGEKTPLYKFVLKDNGVEVTVTYDIKLKGKYKNTTTMLEKFSTVQYSDFFKHVYFAREITLDQMDRANSLCYTCMYDAASLKGIQLETEEINVGDAMAVFYVLDGKFVFANRVDFEDEEEEFIINNIPDQIVEADYDYSLQITANKPVAQWSDDSEFFDIDNDGQISFKPTDDDIGNFLISVKATDEYGNNASKTFMMKIVSGRGEAPFAPNVRINGKLGQEISYDIDAETDQAIKYSGAFDQFTIDPDTGKFSFIPKKKGIFVYDYYVIKKDTGKVNIGEISIIIS